MINIKPGRVGGLSEAVRIHDWCRSHGVPVWCGGMLESRVVGHTHNLALASLPGFTLPGDLSPSDRYFEREIVKPPITLLLRDACQCPMGLGSASKSTCRNSSGGRSASAPFTPRISAKMKPPAVPRLTARGETAML